MITNIFILRIFLFFLYIPDLSTFHYFWKKLFWKKWTYFQVKIFSTICFSSQYFVYLFYFHVSENEFNFLFFLIKKKQQSPLGECCYIKFSGGKRILSSTSEGISSCRFEFQFLNFTKVEYVQKFIFTTSLVLPKRRLYAQKFIILTSTS